MNFFVYSDNANHGVLLFRGFFESIGEADAAFTKETGINPMRVHSIGCQILNLKQCMGCGCLLSLDEECSRCEAETHGCDMDDGGSEGEW